MPKFSKFSYGLYPNYAWKDGVVGSKAHFVGTHDSSDTWMSLFLDLVYVCLFAKLTELLHTCEATNDLFVYTATLTLMFFSSRVAIDEYAIRFYRDDVLNRILFLAYTASIVIMVMNVDLELGHDSHTCSTNDDFYFGLTVGFVGTRACLVAMYSAVMHFDKSGKATSQFHSRVASMIVSCIFFVSANWAVENKTTKIYLLILISVFEPVCTFVLIVTFKMVSAGWLKKETFGFLFGFHYPLNIYKIQERAATFFLIVVGEAMFDLLIKPWHTNISTVYLVTLFGFLLLFALSMQYYDRGTRHEHEINAARRSSLAGILFGYAHAVLAYFMLIATQGIVAVALAARLDSARNPLPHHGEEFLVYGCAGASFTILYMRFLHEGFLHYFQKPSRTIRVALHTISSAMHFALLGSHAEPRYQLVAHAMIASFIVLTDMSMDLIVSHLFPSDVSAHGHRRNSASAPAAPDLSVAKVINKVLRKSITDIEKKGEILLSDLDGDQRAPVPHRNSMNGAGPHPFQHKRLSEATLDVTDIAFDLAASEAPLVDGMDGDSDSDSDDNEMDSKVGEQIPISSEHFKSEDVVALKSLLGMLPTEVIIACVGDRASIAPKPRDDVIADIA